MATEYRIDNERVVKRGSVTFKADGARGSYSAVLRWGKLYYTFDAGISWSSNKRQAFDVACPSK